MVAGMPNPSTGGGRYSLGDGGAGEDNDEAEDEADLQPRSLPAVQALAPALDPARSRGAAGGSPTEAELQPPGDASWRWSDMDMPQQGFGSTAPPAASDARGGPAAASGAGSSGRALGSFRFPPPTAAQGQASSEMVGAEEAEDEDGADEEEVARRYAPLEQTAYLGDELARLRLSVSTSGGGSGMGSYGAMVAPEPWAGTDEQGREQQQGRPRGASAGGAGGSRPSTAAAAGWFLPSQQPDPEDPQNGDPDDSPGDVGAQEGGDGGGSDAWRAANDDSGERPAAADEGEEPGGSVSGAGQQDPWQQQQRLQQEEAQQGEQEGAGGGDAAEWSNADVLHGTTTFVAAPRRAPEAPWQVVS